MYSVGIAESPAGLNRWPVSAVMGPTELTPISRQGIVSRGIMSLIGNDLFHHRRRRAADMISRCRVSDAVAALARRDYNKRRTRRRSARSSRPMRGCGCR